MRAAILLAYGAAVSAMGLPALLPRGSDFAKCFLQGDCHCDLSKVAQPSSGLPGPDSGMKPAMIAIGRGTQNYTCPDAGNATAVPVAVGALAKLYDFSCVASRTTPEQFGNMTAAMQQVNRNDPIFDILPSVGVHYFNKTVPTFFLNNKLGTTPTKKLNSTAAPTTATNAVAWLKLEAAEGATGAVKEVYRLDTANGNAPATCGDKKGLFTVEYAAEYWFYAPDTFCW